MTALTVSSGFNILGNMKDISKLTKEQIEAFIMGVVATFERGDSIDERKELQWIITEMPLKWSIKAMWIKSATHYKSSNPMTDKDSNYVYDDYYFSISTKESPRKLCSEILDTIDVINTFEFNENY